MKRLFSLVFLAGFVSCATIVNGKKEVVEVRTSPDGALVEANGQKCTTPCHLELTRGRNYVVRITKEGYEPQKHSLDGSSLDGWLWGNVLLGGLIGLAVDVGSNAAYDFDPDGLSVVLQKTQEQPEKQMKPNINREVASVKKKKK